MDVSGIRVNLELVLLRYVMVTSLLARSDDLTDAEMLGFFVGLLGEAAGEHIAARMFFRRVVQRDHRELLARTALAEEHFVVIAEAHEVLDILLGARWLISRMDIPLLLKFRNSACASLSTSSGSVAGPGLKL